MVVVDRSASRAGSGFRLSGRDSVSSASLYKQRIDSMFDEERSVISHTYGSSPPKPPSTSSRLDGPGGLGRAEPAPDNLVQAGIERMFSELALEAGGGHCFRVDYLGCTPLPRRVSSLAGLQAPLARLYLAYRRARPATAPAREPAARLDISRAGLHVRSAGARGELEQLNPFPTIAVWSAVKFVLQQAAEDKNTIQYAFLPLITDPDNIDKQALFQNLEPAEKKYLLGRDINAHSPLFTVVMRKIGVAKQLECHGFVCQTSEDAIVIAATLYKSLMAHMSRVPRARGGLAGPSIASSSAPVRPPRRKRTPSSVSAESDPRNSVRKDSMKQKSVKSRRAPGAPEPPPPPPPNKPQAGVALAKAKPPGQPEAAQTNTPPKSIYNESINFLSNQQKNSNSSKDSSVRSKVSEKIELFSGLEKAKDIQRPATLPPPVPEKPKKEATAASAEHAGKATEYVGKGPVEPLRRSHSLRNSCEPGDILTKVAIPRSGSFLNASGLSRYKSTGHRNNGKKGGGSPLGFSELFNEFRVQEDLHSMDDILGAIIDAEGMSFNDLKPIYKEFLLKLAVTLTKDELFQHSKAIMRRQKKKLLRRNSTVQNKRKKMLIGAKGLKLVFRKPFGKDILKSKLLHMGEKKHKANPFEIPQLSTNKKKLIVTSESSVSTSSYDLRQFHPRDTSAPVPKRQSVRRRDSKRSGKNGHAKSSTRAGKRAVERVSTSEDSDFLTLSRRMGYQNRNSSSGYVSCSECESESCADRCYCAARARPRAPAAVPPAAVRSCCDRDDKCCDCTGGESSRCYSCCGCDTESCADSDKCYCHASMDHHPTVTSLQAKKRHNVPSSRHVSNKRHNNNDCHVTTKNRHAANDGRHVGGNRHATVDCQQTQHIICQQQKCTSRRSPRRRSAPGPGPATLDSLYYEPLRQKANSMSDHRGSGLEYLTRRTSRLDTFEQMSCMTDLGRSSLISRRTAPPGRRTQSSDNLTLDYNLFSGPRGFHYSSRGGSTRLPMSHYGSKEALITHKKSEIGALFSDGRLLSAHRGLYRGPSAALADSLGYLP